MERPGSETPLPEARFRRLLLQAVIVPIGVLALVAVVLAVLVAYQVNAARWVEHTDQVIRQASVIDSDHLEATAMFRGYALAHDPESLEAARGGIQRANEELATLRRMIADNPPQAARVDRLIESSNDWRTMWEDAIEGGRSAPDLRVAQRQLHALRQQLAEVITVEEAMRQRRLADAWWATRWVIGGGALVMATAAIVLALWARAQLRDLAWRYSTAVDETQSRAAEAERINQALQALVEATPLPVIAVDTSARVTLWNPAAERVFGWTREEVFGKPLPQVGFEQEASARDVFTRSMHGERIVNMEIERRTKDGRLLHFSLAAAPLRGANAEIVGMIGISTDMTDRKRTEIELKEAKEAAEAANRAKDQFLAVLSHELRTPLTPALTVLQLLEEQTGLPGPARQDVALARRNIEVEARLIDDLLDLTRVSRGKLQMRMETVDVHAAVRNALGVCREEIGGKKLEVTIDLRARQHYVRGDPARLQQVFWNLVKNAVKFTPAHGRLVVRSEEPEPGRVSVSISDTGIGIPAEILPRIFQPFEQGEQSITRRFGGLGLGLAISKALIDGHGGTLKASSEGLGRGSTFTAELATTTASMSDEHARGLANSARRGPLKILLVEDHEDTSRVMARFLGSLGHKVSTAGNVASALETAAAARFDLIISDIGLPDGSGLDFIREVRKSSDMPAIALSGFGMEADVSRSLAAGFNDHLTKPVNLHTLERAIEDIMSGTPAKG